MSSGAVWHIASKIYDAAGIRLAEGNRRGTHLFRYNVATIFVGSGIPRPVASAVLGHEDPSSLHRASGHDRKISAGSFCINHMPIP
ncbi:hypothetical protein DXB25_00575 [Lachnospiraceae bacterium OM02-31]|nr:hypothetical protein DXB25_00575 [Lachnospiraceae bacterium OM02-31]RJW58838.1 hypothetical protein DXB24_02880 [Lachnospiraceae bacterium OM02-3]